MKILAQIVFLTIGFSTYAQQSLVDRLFPLQQDPVLKEKVFVHTNKTSYFPEDAVWFKAYVGDTINYPSLATTKLYVNLLDAAGTVIYTKNIFIDKGTGQGEFELDSAVLPGKYYVQAYTNYMRNFGDTYTYSQEITVLGEKPEESDTPEVVYDVQLFPEGGYLLEAVENVVGIKALINGKGMDFSGEIVNSKGKPVTGFKNAHLGMARCKFSYKAGERYSAQIAINDTLIKIDVPQALKKGVVLQTDNSEDTYLTVSLKTNEQTFYEQVQSKYTLLFHQDHQIYGLVSVARVDSTVATLKTDKTVFLPGVHTVTLFENDRPIAERKFFVEKDLKQPTIHFDRLQTENDSITYKLRLSHREEPLEADLSISVLSENTHAYDGKQHLRSAFLLTPYLKGNVEDPAYYFDQKNPERKEHVDLLLLTQGWSQYSLKEMIRTLKPEPNFRFDHGFAVQGALEGPILHNRLALIADDYQVIDRVNLGNHRKFRFDELLLYKGDTVKVSYLNWLGKLIKPKALRFDEGKQRTFPFPKRVAQDVPPATTKSTEQRQDTPAPQDSPPLQVERGTIALEGVTLTDRKLSQRMVERRALIKKYKPVVPNIGQYYNRSIPEHSEELDLMSFLQRTEGIRMQSFQGIGNNLVAPGDRGALLFIDGRKIDSYELPSVSIYMTDIENVMVSPSRKVPFANRLYITLIHVFTKDSYRKNTVPLFNEHIVTDGYDTPKKYYMPLYEFDKNRYANWIEVDWKPVVKTDKKGVVFIKIPKGASREDYLFSVQGFSEKGHLISELLID